MKLIGLIGGTTWLSTLEYYKLLNQIIHQKLGHSNSAKLLLYSVNFEEFKPTTDLSKWTSIAERLAKIAKSLEDSGAEGLAICANTPHLVADFIQGSIRIPLIHIADATAFKIKSLSIQKVALLGTRLTMEQDFFKQKLLSYNIESVIPIQSDREYIHDTILNELGKGIFRTETREKYLEIIRTSISQGAEGIILGCTEIPLLILQDDISFPLFDTTRIHSEAIVDFALS